ncbi:MAG TPA: hypothetical protein VG097_08655 [Gemmata sp.]|jgi:hypothetical protein|nr:hypothetical protein [Gemmata sp.]
MNDESKQTPKQPIPRIDSFEIIDADCTPFLTDEEKRWPVAALQPRIDSFEISEPHAIESVEVEEATTLELTLFLSTEIAPNTSEMDARLTGLVESLNAIDTAEGGAGYILGGSTTEPGKIVLELSPIQARGATARLNAFSNRLNEGFAPRNSLPGIGHIEVIEKRAN